MHYLFVPMYKVCLVAISKNNNNVLSFIIVKGGGRGGETYTYKGMNQSTMLTGGMLKSSMNFQGFLGGNLFVTSK